MRSILVLRIIVYILRCSPSPTANTKRQVPWGYKKSELRTNKILVAFMDPRNDVPQSF
jgi:hypothetical protein